jgi:uncharacterized protein
MNYLRRAVETRVAELLTHFPVVAVLGARQVGKTTLVERLGVPGLKTVTFDPTGDRNGARADPDFFLQNQPRPLFLDEIQYAPELLGSIKREVDRAREPGRFVLSGSQNLSVLRSISESLAGRVAIVELLPLSYAELRGEPSRRGWLERVLLGTGATQEPRAEIAAGGPPALFPVLWRGGLPGLLGMPDRLCPTYFDSYRRTYIERDVRTAAAISSLPTFGRFFSILAALTGREVNRNELGRELGVDRKTAQAWIEIGESTYQWREIPAYSRNALKRVAGKAKGYFTDTGLACALQSISSPDHLAHHPAAGHLFETFVVGEALKRAAAWNQRPNAYHYRTFAGAEVDLVLEMDGALHPIEIKMTARPSRRDLRGVDSFREAFPGAKMGKALVVCAVEEATPLREDALAVPWWDL